MGGKRRVKGITDLTDAINAHVAALATLIALGAVNHGIQHLLGEMLVQWPAVQLTWINWQTKHTRMVSLQHNTCKKEQQKHIQSRSILITLDR